LKKIKQLGFLVKLDSNGSNPTKLAQILEQKLVDFVAMDVKQTKEKYHLAAGVSKINLKNLEKSISLIQKSGIDYEFRTTVVPQIHSQEDLLGIANWLKGSQNYALQTFRPEVVLDSNLKNFESNQILNLNQIAKQIESNFGKVVVRG
jgi:pyruvate formate lyase activating enzyme